VEAEREERDADGGAAPQYGGTCLHWAASKGRKEVIQYLCMKGIDIHITSYVRTVAEVTGVLEAAADSLLRVRGAG
jgi:predicted SpoU family rRNA methylase